MEARELSIDDRPWAERLVTERFASFRIVSRGVLHDTRALPGLLAERDGTPIENEIEFELLLGGTR
jgi:hypothetical protein